MSNVRRLSPTLRIGQRTTRTREFQLKEGRHSFAPVDLSSADAVTITLEHYRWAYSPVEDGECEITDASEGKVEYTFSQEETSLHGRYTVQFEVDYGDETELVPPDSEDWVLDVGRRQPGRQPFSAPRIEADEATFGDVQVDDIEIGNATISQVVGDPDISSLSIDSLDVGELDGGIVTEGPLDGSLHGPGLTIDQGDLAVTLELEEIEGLTNPLNEHVDANDYDINNVRNFDAKRLDRAITRDHPVVNVDWFGAEGDGEADDTQAFVDALEHIETELGKGVLTGSSGKDYRVDPLNIPTIDPAHVRGVSFNNSAIYLTSDNILFDVVGSDDGSSDPQDTTTAVQQDELNFTVKDTRFMGEDFVGTAIRFQNSHGVHVRGCQITGLKDGIIFEGFNRNSFVISNLIYNLGRYGVHYKDGDHHQTNFVGNHIMGMDILIYITGMDGLTDLQVSGNDFEVFDTDEVLEPSGGIIAENNTLVTGLQIVGNTMDDHLDLVGPMIGIYGDADQISAINNQATFLDAPFFEIEGAFEVNCAYNTVKRVDNSVAFRITNCEEVTLAGNGTNDVRDGGMFVVDNSQQVSIYGNAARNINGPMVSSSSVSEFAVASNVARDVTGDLFGLGSVNRLSLVGNAARGITGDYLSADGITGGSIAANNASNVSGDMMNLIDPIRVSVSENNGREISGDYINADGPRNFSVVGNAAIGVDGWMVDTNAGRWMSISSNNFRNIGQGGIRASSSRTFSIADNTAEELSAPMVDVTGSDSYVVSGNCGSDVSDHLISVSGGGSSVGIYNNASRDAEGLFELDGEGNFFQALFVIGNQNYNTKSSATNAIIHIHNTRLFGSSVNDNYVRTHGPDVWGVDISGDMDYYSGSHVMGNSINCDSSADDSGIRLNAGGYVATIVKNNVVRGAATAYDLPAAEEDNLVVEHNLSGSGLT